jgi:hypothetical protein
MLASNALFNSSSMSVSDRSSSREHQGEHRAITGEPHDTNGPHG